MGILHMEGHRYDSIQKNAVWQGTLSLMVLRTLLTGWASSMGTASPAASTDQPGQAVDQLRHPDPQSLKLEQEGLIASHWGVSDNNRKAKFTSSPRRQEANRARHQAVGNHLRDLHALLAANQDWRTRTLRAWLVRVIGFARPCTAEQEFADRAQSHIELHVADNLRAGRRRRSAPPRARQARQCRIGAAKHTAIAAGLPALESLIQDAVRRSVAWAATAPSPSRASPRWRSGIGVNSAIFSVVNAVLFVTARST